MLADAIEAFQVPGASLAIWQQGRLSVEVAGVACLAARRPVRGDTRFQIGSVTKLLTAALAHRLLPLDEPLGALVPEWQGTGKALLTPALLLSHRSGLDGDAFEQLGEGEAAASALLRLTAADPLLHPPGAATSYCNLAFVALGLALARRTGRSWDRLVREELAEPAGARGLSAAEQPGDAVGHVAGRAAPVGMLAASNAAAGTTLRASAQDLLGLLVALAGWAGPAPLFPGMEAASAPCAPIPDGHEVAGFGLGPARFGWSSPCFGHDGMTIGQQSFARLWPRAGVALVLMGNGGDMRGLARAVLSDIGDRLAGSTPPPLLAAASGSMPPPGVWRRRNASLQVEHGPVGATLARVQHEGWAEQVYGQEGPWPLVEAGPGHWLWQVPGQQLPVPVALVQDGAGQALHLGMRRYNLVCGDCS